MSARRRAAAAAAAMAAALAARAVLWEPRALRVREVEIAAPGWPASLDGLRIAAVSDLHAGVPGFRERGIERVVRAVRDARPDLVALLGDFVDPSVLGARLVAPYAVARRLATLRAPLGVVAVLGNHDWMHAGSRMPRALADAGIAVLENEARRVNDELWVVGLADVTTRHPDTGAAFAGVPDGAAVLCLTHDPDAFPRVPARASLTLAGHTHGGQVNLPWLRSLVIPSAHGDRYAAGHVVEAGRHLYVSRGIGTSRLPVRLLSPPEVVLLRVRSETWQARAPVAGVDLQLTGGPDAPAEARAAIREELAAHLSEEECFELELLVTELVTNAVLHGGMRDGQAVGLIMRVDDEILRVEVHDSGPGFNPGTPHPRDFEQGGGGLGLVLLDRFAREWGVDRARGSRVWADIPRKRAAA